tara:strand:- start:53 stop:187 length:135 start_codon:yes stop_codon:yes gene_type:complete
MNTVSEARMKIAQALDRYVEIGNLSEEEKDEMLIAWNIITNNLR